jgi:hypothetical protein
MKQRQESGWALWTGTRIWRIGAILDSDSYLWEAHSPNHAGYGKTPLEAITKLRDKINPGWRETRDPLDPGENLPEGWKERPIVNLYTDSVIGVWYRKFEKAEFRVILEGSSPRFSVYLIFPGFRESTCFGQSFDSWWDAMDFAEKWAERNLNAT